MTTRVIHIRDSRFGTDSGEGEVYIGRPSVWRNPFIIGRDGDRSQVLEKYKAWLPTQTGLLEYLDFLKDKTLVCYCAPLPCHGDILADLADGECR